MKSGLYFIEREGAGLCALGMEDVEDSVSHRKMAEKDLGYVWVEDAKDLEEYREDEQVGTDVWVVVIGESEGEFGKETRTQLFWGEEHYGSDKDELLADCEDVVLFGEDELLIFYKEDIKK